MSRRRLQHLLLWKNPQHPQQLNLQHPQPSLLHLQPNLPHLQLSLLHLQKKRNNQVRGSRSKKAGIAGLFLCPPGAD